MRHTYEIVPGGNTTLRVPPTCETLKEAQAIASRFRSCAYDRVSIYRDGTEIAHWRRDGNGNGRRWFKAEL